MTNRTPNVTRAIIEFGFVVLGFLCGLFAAPMWVTAGAGLAMIAYWSWSRRASLARLGGANLLIQAGLAIALIIVVFAIAYWLGASLTGGGRP